MRSSMLSLKVPRILSVVLFERRSNHVSSGRLQEVKIPKINKYINKNCHLEWWSLSLMTVGRLREILTIDSAITRKIFVFGKDRRLWKGVLTRRCRTWRSSWKRLFEDFPGGKVTAIIIDAQPFSVFLMFFYAQKKWMLFEQDSVTSISTVQPQLITWRRLYRLVV